MSASWDPDEIRRVSRHLAGDSPLDVLRWALAEFGDGAVMGTGFGYSGVALAHMLSEVRPGATLFYLDTDLFFEETYELRQKLDTRLSLHIERVHSGVSLEEQRAEEGAELWKRDPDRCCFIRKVKPLRDYLTDKRAWITAIRRDQSASRAATEPVEWNATHDLVKVNPLAYWTDADAWDYVQQHDLPYNPLHDQGYPSIGCVPCTAPVADGDDQRAGRWAGQQKTECGLHRDEQPA